MYHLRSDATLVVYLSAFTSYTDKDSGFRKGFLSVLVWNCLGSSFIDTTWIFILRISHFTFLDTSRVWIFDGNRVSIPFGSIYHARTFILRLNRPGINMVWNSIDPTKTRIYKDTITLIYP